MGRKLSGIWMMAGFAAVLVAALPAAAQGVRIISVDGQLVRDGRAGPVKVWPGQVVSLAADETWIEAGQLEFAYRPVEDFRWVANDVPGDVCDPVTDCRAASNFEATDYGVNFYVPRNAPRSIEISVQSKFQEGSDRIQLINEAREAAFRDGWDYGLGNSGWWTVIGGERVFVPNAYEDDWAPFVHGHWYWTSFGWTWYSYDPWGDVTDHYGHWRHHGVYGWVWAPDPLWLWRPAIVSFFFGDGFIGWWPYDSGWSHGYRHGYAHGYDDGYWMGYWAGRRAGDGPGRRVRPGATCVAYGDFYVPGGHGRPPARADGGSGRPPPRAHDIASVRIKDRAMIDRNLTTAVRLGAVGSLPGGAKDVAQARQFIAQKAGVMPSEVALKTSRASVGATQRRGFEPVKPLFERPETYRAVTERVRTNVSGTGMADRGVRASIGSPALRASVDRASVRPGRGLAPAPTMRAAGTSAVQTWSPRGRDAIRPDAGRAASSAEPRSVGAQQRTDRQDLRLPARPDAARETDVGRASSDRVERVQPAVPAWERGPAASPGREVPQEATRDSVFDREGGAKPGIGLPVDRGMRPDESVRPDRAVAPAPAWQRETPQPGRTVPQRDYRPERVAPVEPSVRAAPAQPARTRVEAPATQPRPEVRAPAPEVRRESPREVYRPRDTTPSRPSFGGGSPSGSSSPPPYVAPTRPRPSAPPVPRFSPAPRRSR